ncbi:phosphotransferase [Aquihabitans sp. G128]|uniref:phosphotransferase n=1 Tax=Aquihabitans sp. G128 TaxID=2849779 RepID=UPI001C21564D|nr:phosphotransferase [Aquihabitans sp. G128]QXC61191.1 phosphotransferase [Aquihabitans sp. G128]
MADAPDLARAAGDEVLDRLVPVGDGGAEATAVIREGAALVLRRGPVLVRVRPAAHAEVAHREVALAQALAAAEVPVTALVEAAEQPWVVGDQVVTAWRWSEGGAPVSDADLGALAAALRDRTAAVASTIAPFDPIESVLLAVADHPAHDDEAAFVRDRAAALAGRWSDAASEAGRLVVVHGDLHRDNVVAGPRGPLLTDLELSGSGPAGYDVARAVVAVERYGDPVSSLGAFLAAYGEDPRGSAAFATFVDAYELWVTAWAVGVRGQDPSWAAEAARRVATLRDGADETWTLR